MPVEWDPLFKAFLVSNTSVQKHLKVNIVQMKPEEVKNSFHLGEVTV